MNAKELFILIDKIDPKFVEEAWSGGIESEEPVKVVLEHNSSPFIRLAAAAAACVIMFGAGMFVGIKFFGGVSVLPGSQPEDSSSDSESNTGDYEIIDSNSTDKDIEKVMLFDFNFIMLKGKATSADYSIGEKQDNLDYALLNIENTDASRDNPIIAYICDENKIVHSETIEITGNGEYRIYYDGLRGAGAPCVLWMELPGDSDANRIACAGTWSP